MNALHATHLLSLPQALEEKAREFPDKPCFHLLENGVDGAEVITYRELYAASTSLAANLRASCPRGSRVLLQYPTGFDFITAFFGCMYAGVIPVPVAIPGRRSASHLTRIMADAEVEVVLTNRVSQDLVEQWMVSPADRDKLLTTDLLAKDVGFDFEPVPADGVAFIQYTSGSTSQPRGVMVTQRNLLHNLAALKQLFQAGENSVGVSWLPLFHDMGLIGNILHNVYLGSTLVLLPSQRFVEQPLRWLQAISTYRATISGAPNFAFKACFRAANSVNSADLRELDLSSLERLYCGAELVSVETLQAFCKQFARHGLDPHALLPVYGLAEHTLIAASGTRRHNSQSLFVKRKELERGEVVTVTGAANATAASSTVAYYACGRPAEGEQVVIVEPQQRVRLPEDRVGEIWLASPSVAAGYWNQPELSSEVFAAQLADGQGPFLRTGDLGFLHEGELYVIGRLKEMFIIRGRNYFPADIELAVEQSHVDIQASGVAAVSVSKQGDRASHQEDQLVVLVEISREAFRNVDISKVTAAIQQAIGETFGIAASDVVLLRPAQLLRTSSGKIRRIACAQAYVAGTLKRVQEQAATACVISTPKATTRDRASEVDEVETRSRRKADELCGWLQDYASHRINSRLIDERRSIPPHIVLDFGNQGILGMPCSPAFGGQGMVMGDSLRVVEQLAAIDTTLAAFVGVHHALGVYPIEHHATDAIRQRWLPGLAAGRELAAFAITEPGAGSNPRAMQTTATPIAGGWSLRGTKSWIGTAGWASVINVFARTLAEDGSLAGINGFVVPQGRAGFRVGPEAMTMGMRGMVQNSLLIDGAEVTREELLGTFGEGMPVAQEAMMLGRLGLGAISVGAMKRCAQLMMRYAERRTIDTGLLMDNPLTRHRLDHLLHQISAVQTLVYRLADDFQRGVELPAEAFAACKVAGSEYLSTATDQLMQMLGARGYIETNVAPQLYRDARLLRIFEGPSETLRMFIGTRALMEFSKRTHDINRNRQLQTFFAKTLGAKQPLRALRLAIGQLETLAHDRGLERAWLAGSVGELVILTTLWAAAAYPQRGEPNGELVTWLESQFQQQLFYACRHDVNPPPYLALREHAARIVATIGDVEQTMPGEEHESDAMLRPVNFAKQSILSDPNFAKAVKPSRATKLAADREAELPAQPVGQLAPVKQLPPGDAVAIEQWIVNWLAEQLGIPPREIDPHQSVARWGLDSVMAVELTFALEKRYQVEIPAATLWNRDTVASLAAWLGERIEERANEAIPKSGGVGKSRLAEAMESKAMDTRSAMSIIESERAADSAVYGVQPSFSLLFFSSEAGQPESGYELVIEAAQFADQHGFEAVWVPERHFHPFGGVFPNPATLAAALSAKTQRLRIRAGSVVLPLHDPIRVAEEWAMVDVLSKGRVDVAFTKGWNLNDFVLFPERFQRRHDEFPQLIDTVQRLWRGESIKRENGGQSILEVRTFPRPIQTNLPIWITCNRDPNAFQFAGSSGAKVLTALLSQTLEQLRENIITYRQARKDAGLDPQTGRVTLMLHTFIGDDLEEVKSLTRQPLIEYLKNSVDLWRSTAQQLDEMSEQERQRALDFAFERYFRSSSLIGTVDSARKMVDRVVDAGVDEIASLLDFGLPADRILNALPNLNQLRQHSCREALTPLSDAAPIRRTNVNTLRTSNHSQSSASHNVASASHNAIRPLSAGETAMWLAAQWAPNSAAYNQAISIQLEGELDRHRAQQAWRDVVDRHSHLRSIYLETQGKLACHFGPSPELAFEQPIALDAVSGGDEKSTVRNWIQRHLALPFSLAKGPNVSAHLLPIADDRNLFTVINHHVVADGRAIQFVINDWLKRYHDLCNGQLIAEHPQGRSMGDYALWERQWLEGAEAQGQLGFWKDQLGGGLPWLKLPRDRDRQTQPSLAGGICSRDIDPQLAIKFRQIAKEAGTTPAKLWLAAYCRWLHRVTDQETVVVGLATHGAAHHEFEKVVGNIMNPVPIVSHQLDQEPLHHWVSALHQTVSQALAHGTYPFSELVSRLNLPRQFGRTPVYQTTFNYLNDSTSRIFKGLSLSKGALRAQLVDVPQQAGQVDLALEIVQLPGSDAVQIRFKYAGDVFNRETVSRLLDDFHEQLIQRVEQSSDTGLSGPEAAVCQLKARDVGEPLPVLSGQQVQIAETSLHRWFMDQVSRAPDKIAVETADGGITYRELDKQSNQLARFLSEQGLSRGGRVGIYCDRGLLMLVSVLGVLKADAAYVPLVINVPERKLCAVLEQAELDLIIRDTSVSRFPQQLLVSQLLCDSRNYARGDYPWMSYSSEPLATSAGPRDLAYVMFTSGTTGQPKGVQVEHGNVLNLLRSMQREPGFTNSDSLLAVTPLTFDISVLELLLPLVSGGKLVIAATADGSDPARLIEVLHASGATVMQATPATWSMLLTAGWRGDQTLRALCGGEALSLSLARKLLQHCGEVWNLYGPTETTIWSTLHRLHQEQKTVAIGRPICNTHCLIVDQQTQPVAGGQIGELLIAGAGVSRGYLCGGQQKSLASKCIAGSEMHWYRTGDLCRQNIDGAIEYVGRPGSQVKIRGHRVELGEIEAAIALHPSVSQAIVLATEAVPGEIALIAHLVPAKEVGSGDDRLQASSLRRHLKEILPDYMLPQHYQLHAKFPLTPHGKVDRSALAVCEGALISGHVEYVPPRTELERQLCQLWEQVLGSDRVGLHDNFFDLGGDSLKATRLVAKVSDLFSMPITITELFAGQTVAEMAGRMEDPVAIDWELETALPAAVAKLPDISLDQGHFPEATSARLCGSPPAPVSERSVLLTGATGFVGAHVLRDLCEQTDCHVVCLVRAGDDQQARLRLDRVLRKYKIGPLANYRVDVVAGDLAKPRMGLEESRLTQLVEQVGQIIHAAAWVNFVYPYSVVKWSNVEATRNLIEFAFLDVTRPPKSFVFASTLAVFAAAQEDQEVVLPRELDAPDSPDQLRTGYAKSKATGEFMLLKAAVKGLPLTIVRGGVVSGNSTNHSWSKDQWLPQALHAAHALTLVPTEYLATVIRLTPVDQMSRVMVAATGVCSAQEANAGQEQAKQNQNLVHSLVQPMLSTTGAVVVHLDGQPHSLQSLIERYPGKPIESIHYDDWRTRILDQGDDNLTALLLIFPPSLEDATDLVPEVCSDQTRQLLTTLRINCPVVDQHVIDGYWSEILKSFQQS